VSNELKSLLDERQQVTLARLQDDRVAFKGALREAGRSGLAEHPIAWLGVGVTAGFLAQRTLSKCMRQGCGPLVRSAFGGVKLWALGRLLG